MTFPQQKTIQMIGLSASELRAKTDVIERAKLGSRAELLEHDNANGLEPALHVYRSAFRFKDDSDLLSPEGAAEMAKLRDEWHRFFDALTRAGAKREACKEAEKAHRQMHSAAVDALHGRYVDDEQAIWNEFLASLETLSKSMGASDKYQLSQLPQAKEPGKRNPREEHILNEDKIRKYLHDVAFSMLSMPPEKRNQAFKDMNGHSIAVSLNIRENSVGNIIDLKATLVGKDGQRPNITQLFYLICTNETVYYAFEKVAKPSDQKWDIKPIEELYHLVMSEIDRVAAAHQKSTE